MEEEVFFIYFFGLEKNKSGLLSWGLSLSLPPPRVCVLAENTAAVVGEDDLHDGVDWRALWIAACRLKVCTVPVHAPGGISQSSAFLGDVIDTCDFSLFPPKKARAYRHETHY